MSRVWMPLYIGDFLADTMHLGPTERGIYISLIMHAWQHGGSIPLDDARLCNITGCEPRLWWKYKRTALQFFDAVDASTAQHKRVVSELLRSDEISNKRKAAALQKHSKSSAKAMQMHTQSQSQSHTEEEEAKASSPSVVTLAAKRGARLADDWQPSDADLKEAGKIGLRLYEIDNEIPKFRDYWHARAGPGAVKRDWSATWRNWCRKFIEDKPKEGGNGRQLQDDRLSVGKAAERLMALPNLKPPPRPSLVSATSQTDRRLLPKG